MKSKALCLAVGGLIVTAGAVGNTVFTDTQARPDNAQNTFPSTTTDLDSDHGLFLSANEEVVEEEQRNDDWREHVTFNDEANAPEKMLELDVYIKPTGNVNQALALYFDDNDA